MSLRSPHRSRRLAQCGLVLALAGGLLAPTAGAGASGVRASADTVPPTVSLTHRDPDARGWHRGTVEVTVSASDRSGIDDQSSTVTLAGATSGITQLDGGRAVVSIDATGETSVTAEVRDTEGNVRRSSTLVRVDNLAPTIADGRIGDGQILEVGENVTLRTECADAHVGVALCRVEGDGVGPDGQVNTSAPGQYVVSWSAADHLGNRSSRSVRYRVIPTGVRPSVNLHPRTAPNADGWHRGPVTLDVTARPGHEDVPVTETFWQVGPEGRRAEGAAGVATVTGEGQTRVTARARDARGGRSDEVETTIRIDSVRPTAEVMLPERARQGEVWHPGRRCDDVAGSGIVSCEIVRGLAPGTERLDTREAGTLQVEVRAVDRAGNITTEVRDLQIEPAADVPSTVAVVAPREVRSTARTTITLQGRHAGRPVEGTATVSVDGRVVGTTRMLPADSPDANARTRGTFTLPRLAPGDRRIGVSYAPGQGVQTSQSASTIRSKAPGVASGRYKVSRTRAGSASVTVTADGARPRGRVEVYAGSRRIGTASLDTRGRATVRLPKLRKGTHSLRVRYLGSTTVLADWSPTTRVRVR